MRSLSLIAISGFVILFPAVAQSPTPSTDIIEPPVLATDANPLARAPLPLAVSTLLSDVCFPHQAGEAALSDLIPAGSIEGMDPLLKAQLSAAALPGRAWSVKSLEYPVLIAAIEGIPGGCQILATTPFGSHVSDAVIAQLQTGLREFETYAVDEVAPGIMQSRLKSGDTVFVDILTYAASAARPTTLHVIVQ